MSACVGALARMHMCLLTGRGGEEGGIVCL